MKVVVNTVTFNSSNLLKKTISALLNQTVDIFKIVITDNNSNAEHKINLKKLQNEYPDKIDIIWLKTNTGGAGGFYESMKYAKENYNPEWYWLMDDDAYPDDDTLEILIEKSRKLDNIGYIAPIIYGIDKNEYQLYHARKQKGKICKFTSIASSIDELHEIEKIDVDAFVGPLISEIAVIECGLPRAEYFIEGDDTDYTYRITRKLNGYLVRNAKINHRDLPPENDINLDGWWKKYYWFRNSILFSKNNLKGVQKILSILYFYYYAYKYKCVLYKNKELKKYRVFLWSVLKSGLSDGIHGKTGARLLPLDYKMKLKQWEDNNKGEKN